MAIVLRGKALEQAEKIKQELEKNFGLKGALRSPAHITLHRPFEWKEEKEPELIEKLRLFDGQAHFQLELNGFDVFGKRVIYIAVNPNNALFEYYNGLKLYAKRELFLLNEWEDERGFHPHVTVAFRDLKPKSFNAVLEYVKNIDYTHEVSPGGFSLLKLEDKWQEIEFFDQKIPGTPDIYKASK